MGYAKMQEIKQSFLERLNENKGGIVNIWFESGHVNCHMQMFKYSVSASVERCATDEDDSVEQMTVHNTYTVYTINGQAADLGYKNQFSFIGDMIVGTELNNIAHENGVAKAFVYHMEFLGEESTRQKVMFVFPASIIMPLPLSWLEGTDNPGQDDSFT